MGNIKTSLRKRWFFLRMFFVCGVVITLLLYIVFSQRVKVIPATDSWDIPVIWSPIKDVGVIFMQLSEYSIY
uniref:Uncharacterized protein n=1 Tax=Octopus bimaculoides TaxID=37653 RepID=A0A0L8FLM2_OCTBM